MVTYGWASLLDLPSLEQIEKDCFTTEAFPRRLIKNLLMNPKSIVIKATLPTGKIIGNIIGVTQRVGDESVGRIFSLCVLDEYQKKGFATKLVRLIEEEFILRGVKRIKLEVHVNNITAQQFYKRLCYSMSTIVLPGFYSDGTDALVMIKGLP